MRVHRAVEPDAAPLRTAEVQEHIDDVELVGVHRVGQEAVRLVEIDRRRIDSEAL